MRYATALAKQFTKVLNEWLTPEQLAEVRRLNATPEYARCCATHNYCDANQAMLDAFAETFGRDYQSDDVDVINEAWDRAKAKEFKL